MSDSVIIFRSSPNASPGTRSSSSHTGSAITNSPALRDKEDLLQSIPGVYAIASRTMLALLPELGTLNRQQAAALVGVAPCNRDSGTLRGRRTVWGGRASVRAVLYIGAPAACRYNPLIRAMYDSAEPRRQGP
jgi:transposase